MQKMIVVFCAVLGVTIAAVGLAKLEPKPEKYKDVEGCYIGSLDQMIPLGEARPSANDCIEYSCGRKWVQIVSCGVAVVQPPLELVEDLDKPYPQCCPRIKEENNATADSPNKL